MFKFFNDHLQSTSQLIKTNRQISVWSFDVTKILIKSKWFSIIKSEIIDLKKSKCVVSAKLVAKMPFGDCDLEFIKDLSFEKEVKIFYLPTDWILMIISKNHTLINDILAFREFGILFDLNNCQILMKTTHFSDCYYEFYFWWSLFRIH